ncbi:MAG: aspartyl/asparaginyl beta-hydroxylase domain-containing protein [Pseudomarimonas sp.]
MTSLIQAAGSAANQGRWDEAERCWRQVLAIEPGHPQALHSLGIHAYRRGHLDDALLALRAAQRVTPDDPMLLLSISVVLRDQANHRQELAALDAALAIDPYLLPALLAKGACLERLGQPKAAVAWYRNALKAAPPEPHWPAALRGQLLHARALSQKLGNELAAFLADRIGGRLDTLAPLEAQRFREAGAILSGQSQPYTSQCSQLHVPRLPAIPFYERERFAWVETLEASTTAITAELSALWQREQQEFKPYIAYAPGAPVNQWQELNHSTRWSSYFLWRNGEPQAEHLAGCPHTKAALDAVEMADIGGLCPNAMFSALAPRTRIPPHSGETNARVIVHLPLIVPAHCRYRVGFEQRRWTVGEVLIFDDSIEHEAINDSDELRVVLIFDVWNPLLSTAERELVRVISAATREFQRV